MTKQVSILGATGSIGMNALKVIEGLPQQFQVRYLSAYHQVEALIQQARRFNPAAVVIGDTQRTAELKAALPGVEVLSGREGLLELAGRDDVDIMLNALVGSAGMEPTIRAIEAGVPVALSNKESLVMAGDLITGLLRKHVVPLFPVDSEHSAIWQCLTGEEQTEIARLIVTGSGGPFRTWSRQEFERVTIEQALNHPNWSMGRKITIDSATMMNKGLEVIEARWLFDLPVDQIDIVIHPQSIVHSLVEFQDGSVKAQLGLPDMKIPIQYALTYPHHAGQRWESLDLAGIGTLTFEAPDLEKFECIQLAYDALASGGTAPAVLNVANEHAVYAFLDGQIAFTRIPELIAEALAAHDFIEHPELGDILALEEWTRRFVVSRSVK